MDKGIKKGIILILLGIFLLFISYGIFSSGSFIKDNIKLNDTNSIELNYTKSIELNNTTNVTLGNKSSENTSGVSAYSPEPQENVEINERSHALIVSGTSVKFDFPENYTAVLHISFDSKKTIGRTSALVEMLKERSPLVSELPSGVVYKYLNIWIGSYGAITSDKIENAVVSFKVEKSWVNNNSIDKSLITLNRYSKNKWSQLPTYLSGEDDKYFYFTSKTPGFSPFAITEKKIVSDDIVYSTKITSKTLVSNFTFNSSYGYTPLNFTFTDTSTGTPTSWYWDFGDGNKSTERNPTHKYSMSGIYVVTLVVKNQYETDSKNATIYVLDSSSSSSGGNNSSISGGNSSSSSGRSSSGSSSGGVSAYSPEPQENVEINERSHALIVSGTSVKFDFPENYTAVLHISFDSKKTIGRTSALVEMLKERSLLVSELPSGVVYKYLNIWIGSYGAITSDKIENAVVSFKVEKSWVNNNSIDKSLITLNRYSKNKWSQLPTYLSGEDDKYFYFTSKTPGFSSFAITGMEKTMNEKYARDIDSPIENQPENGKTIADPEDKVFVINSVDDGNNKFLNNFCSVISALGGLISGVTGILTLYFTYKNDRVRN